MLGLAQRDVLARLGFGRWAVIFGIAALSIAQSLDPTASWRGLLLTAIVMIVVAGVLVLPRDERSFAVAAVNACLVLLLLVYAMLVLAPHANSWRWFSNQSYAPLSPSWRRNNRSLTLRGPAGPGAGGQVEHSLPGERANR